MRLRWIALLMLLAVFAAACDGSDAELTTESTIVTGGPSATDPATDATSTTMGSGGESSPSTTLVGQSVAGYEVVHEITNDNGVTQHIVIPEGAYTDVDLQNFVIDLLEANEDLYGAEIFDDTAAAEVFLKPKADRTDEETALLDRHHFLSLTGRSRIDFRGPFAEFPGMAIGS